MKRKEHYVRGFEIWFVTVTFDFSKVIKFFKKKK